MSAELIYEDLSYRIIGVCMDVNNALGSGLKETTYERVVAVGFDKAGIPYRRQAYAPLTYQGEQVGSQYFDFLVEERVVLELKAGDNFDRNNITQVHEYLKHSGLKLGLLINFTRTGIKTKRIVNL